MTKTKILIVDDEEMICTMIKDQLDSNVGHIDIAFNGVEALEKIINNHYDCIISDIQMPRMNGIDLFLTVRNKHSTNLPFIFFSANANEEHKAQVSDYFHFQFIKKPKIETLVDSVALVLNQASPSKLDQ